MKMYEPFSKGRYYKAFVESDGTAYTLTSCDIFAAEIEDGKLKLIEDLNVVDVLADIHASECDEAKDYTITRTYDEDGICNISLPDVTCFDYATFYIFAYKA